MPVHWVDISIPMKPGMTVWPGDPPFTLSPLERVSEGAVCNTSLLSMGTHTGTHIDAPWHYDDRGPKLNEVDTDLFFGPVRVLELAEVGMIRAEDLGAEPLAKRMLLKTRNSAFPVNSSFRKNYAAVEADAAERIVSEGVQLLGVDYLSVEPYVQANSETHRRLLHGGVLVVEGLCLQGIEAGDYQFVVLPLPIHGVDGAPCRAFLGSRSQSS